MFCPEIFADYTYPGLSCSLHPGLNFSGWWAGGRGRCLGNTAELAALPVSYCTFARDHHWCICKTRREDLLGVVAQGCNPSNQEAEAGGSWVQGQPGLNTKILSERQREGKKEKREREKIK